jgi:transcriptional regulator GlxA family with amidase domain
VSTVFVAYDGVVALDLFGPFDALALADGLAVQAGRRPVFLPQIGATTLEPRRLASGPRVLPDLRLVDARPTRVIVPGFVRELERPHQDVVAWLSGLRDVQLISVCTGAFLLARAGRLDGRRVTTHWADAERLACSFPDVEVVPDALFIDDDDVWTSAGVTAGIDLAIALIRKELGPELALEVARRLVVFAHRPGGQSQFSAHLAAQSTDDEAIYAAQQWVLGHLRDDLTVDALARRVGMSPRNFARRFAAEAGTTPAQYVRHARLDAAKLLLESTDLGLDAIADHCGLGSDENLRRLFHRRLSVTPGAYRRRFRS